MSIEIDPRSVVRDSAGFGWSSYMVRLPKGVVMDDLKRPDLWRAVQGSSNSLKKHDLVYVVDHSEAWSADCRVIQADKEKAVLSKPRVHLFEERFDHLPQTEDYRIEWTGAGFCVVRKADGARLTPAVHSVAVAEKEMHGLYPRKG